MGAWTRIGAALAGLALAGCGYPYTAGTGAPGAGAPAPPQTLAATWMIGLETVGSDVTPLLPFTNQLIATIAAMPRTQVVYLGTARNLAAFDWSHAQRIRVAPVLHGDGACMTFLYTIYVDGQQTGRYGLAVPRPVAGAEADPICTDRAANQFYQALVAQGL